MRIEKVSSAALASSSVTRSMILVADIGSEQCSFDVVKSQLEMLGAELGVQIRMQRSEIFEAMHQI